MKKVLIGSKALATYFSDYRMPKDADYIIDGVFQHSVGESGERVEYYDCNRNRGLRVLFERTNEIPTVDELYTLKLSHCFWPVHWEKTMGDLAFMQSHGAKIDENLFGLLYTDWEKIHGKKRAYLKKENEKFFSDCVKREYIHDDIHRAIAYNDRPMFECVKSDLNSAFVSKSMFLGLPFEDKLKLCREEIYVVALERFLIPSDFRHSKMYAYKKACEKLLTSMTKGWFPKFIAENWLSLRKPDNHDFIGLFNSKSDKIKRVEEGFK